MSPTGTATEAFDYVLVATGQYSGDKTAIDLPGRELFKGQVLRENTMMLEMCRELGFRIASDPEEPSSMVVTLELSA